MTHSPTASVTCTMSLSSIFIILSLSLLTLLSVHFSSVIQSCPTPCDPMDCSTPGFPVHHKVLELAHTHVHRVSDAIQPSNPLYHSFSSHLQSFPESGSFQMSKFFALGGQSIRVSASSSVLPMKFRTDFL